MTGPRRCTTWPATVRAPTPPSPRRRHRTWSGCGRIDPGDHSRPSQAIVGGVAYVGSWDGYEYALNVSTGAVLWKAYLGVTHGESDCNPQTAGVSAAASSPAVPSTSGAGTRHWYALNATTGAVRWRVFHRRQQRRRRSLQLVESADRGRVRLHRRGQPRRLPAGAGQAPEGQPDQPPGHGSLSLVPDGSVGGGIWTSPAYSPALNEIFTVTGTETSDRETYAQAVIGIDADTLDRQGLLAPARDRGGRRLGLDDLNRPVHRQRRRADVRRHQQERRDVRLQAGGHRRRAGMAAPDRDRERLRGLRLLDGVQRGDQRRRGLPGRAAWPPSAASRMAGRCRRSTPPPARCVWQHPEAGPVIGAISYANGMVIAGAGGALEVLDAATGSGCTATTPARRRGYTRRPRSPAGSSSPATRRGRSTLSGCPPACPVRRPRTPAAPSGYTCQSIGAAAASDSAASGDVDGRPCRAPGCPGPPTSSG